MRIFRAVNYEALSRRAAGILAAQVILKPDSVLGLATGDSPLGAYRRLIEMYRAGDVDFSDVTAVNLDEYRGLAPDADQSYRWFMDKNLFSQINIKAENTYIPDGLAADAAGECARYERVIRGAGGIDMQLLGIGRNGHIGFNEPGDAFEKETHVVSLSQSTIDANSRFFARAADVPTQAYTMGIGSIMRARRILMIVSGESKAQIVKEAFCGPITPRVPASVLQLHADFTLVGDDAALKEIGSGICTEL